MRLIRFSPPKKGVHGESWPRQKVLINLMFPFADRNSDSQIVHLPAESLKDRGYKAL